MQSNLHNTSLKIVLLAALVCSISISYGQVKANSKLIPSKIGFEFSLGNENNVLFDDPDYSYQSNTYKIRLYYPLIKKKFVLSLIFEPQVVHLNHQLINEQFVTPDEVNYLEKRDRFTKKKEMTLLAIGNSISFQIILYKKLSLGVNGGIGLGYIDTATERLAKGFTFTENLNIELEHPVNARFNMYFSTGFGHVSNLNFQRPNSGYNTLTTSLGISYNLK